MSRSTSAWQWYCLIMLRTFTRESTLVLRASLCHLLRVMQAFFNRVGSAGNCTDFKVEWFHETRPMHETWLTSATGCIFLSFIFLSAPRALYQSPFHRREDVSFAPLSSDHTQTRVFPRVSNAVRRTFWQANQQKSINNRNMVVEVRLKSRIKNAGETDEEKWEKRGSIRLKEKKNPKRKKKQKQKQITGPSI